MFSGKFLKLALAADLATDTLFPDVFQQIFQCFGGISVAFPECMGVDVEGYAGMSMAQAMGYCSNVLICGDQQSRGSVTQSMEWDEW